MQNADRIRSLPNEELAQFVRNINLLGCGSTCAYAEYCKHDGVEEDFCQLGTRLWVEQKYAEEENDCKNNI